MKNLLSLKIQTGFFPQHKLYNYSRVLGRIKQNEGYKNKVYRDQLGNPTIGYGHLVLPTEKYCLEKKYSRKFLFKVFQNDLEKSIFCFKKYYSTKKFPTMVQEVLIEMIFQLGIHGVLKFKKANKYLEKKLYYLAALEMMNSRWYKQTPKRIDKLITILLIHSDK